MALPMPNATFPIPSLHDSIELDCRIYYPRKPKADVNFFGRSIAILAHPYAPLGGSYDDRVVAHVGSVLLRHGVTLVTFNFRGASGAAGRTTWSGKGELGDFVSVYAFVLCCTKTLHASEPETKSSDANQNVMPLLILGGYSYGSMIASCLPPLKLVQQTLANAGLDSTEIEIQSRAQKVGRDLAAYFAMHRDGSLRRERQSLNVPEASSPPGHQVKLGGYESDSASRRISRESSRRSLDAERVRQSIDRARLKFKSRTRSGESVQSASASTTSESRHVESLNDVEPKIAYLLISPITGPVSELTTMFSKPTYENRDVKTGKVMVQDTSASEEKFTYHPACFVYGTKDVFSSQKKLKKWTDELRSKAAATFSSYEIEGAGHFWSETGVSDRLQASVADWLLALAR